MRWALHTNAFCKNTLPKCFYKKYLYLYSNAECTCAISRYLPWPVNANREASAFRAETPLYAEPSALEREKNIICEGFILFCFVFNEKWDSHRGSRLLTSLIVPQYWFIYWKYELVLWPSHLVFRFGGLETQKSDKTIFSGSFLSYKLSSEQLDFPKS